MIKNLPTMRETWVQSLIWKDPLEKRMATLQYSCLENPMDKGTWWAAVHGGGHKELDMIERACAHACTCTHTHTHTPWLTLAAVTSRYLRAGPSPRESLPGQVQAPARGQQPLIPNTHIGDIMSSPMNPDAILEKTKGTGRNGEDAVIHSSKLS